MQKNVYTVRQVAGYIKSVLEDDLILNCFCVTGEISNFKSHPSGHLYFTLKDDAAALRSVMYKNAAAGLDFIPENGIKAVITGRVSLYEKTGDCQLYVEHMKKAGIGGLFETFEELKRKLLAEGLFDEAHKQKLPEYIKRVAVVTSKSGAAVRDIIQIIQRRNKTVKVTIAHTSVQGVTAPAEIARAIAYVNEWGGADCIILGRGGGSYEDLQAFNEELVARAIYASKIPVISAVGHETDFTIADFVADMRAPTPSAAAELVSFDLNTVSLKITNMLNRMGKTARAGLDAKANKLQSLKNRRRLKTPVEHLYDRQIYIHSLQKKAAGLITSRIQTLRTHLSYKTQAAENLSPLKTISRGYALVETENGEIITNIEALPKTVNIVLRDGAAKAEIVERITRNHCSGNHMARFRA